MLVDKSSKEIKKIRYSDQTKTSEVI